MFVASVSAVSSAPAAVFFLAPNGSDVSSGRSVDQALASCGGAVARIAEVIEQSNGVPAGGIEVQIQAGIYRYNDTNACSMNSTFRGASNSPIIFRGVSGSSGAMPVFEGTLPLDATALQPVTNASIMPLINPSAVGKLLVMKTDILEEAGRGAQLEWNGKPMLPSVWPNEGLAYVRRVWSKGAIYAQGRTKGSPPTYNFSHPIGGNFSLAERPAGNWVAEFAAGPGFGENAEVTGYFNYDWYQESHRIARVSPASDAASNYSLQLLDYSRYGLCEALEGPSKSGCGGTAPGRFTVIGLLSEVDSPGEWFYDANARMLYLYPPADSGESVGGVGPVNSLSAVRLGVRSAGTFVSLDNTSHIIFRDLVMSGSVGTLVSIAGGERNVLGGCTLKNAHTGVSLAGGQDNWIVGNDIFDTDSPLSSAGGAAQTAASLLPTRNLVANNHFTQVHRRGTWSVHVRGVGDRFSRNIVHDAPGQVLLPGGPLTMVDGNEVFNTGYVEGDGGVMYSGASLTAGYGMHYTGNFVHHSLEVPGLHGRGGIYFDDHLQAVSNVSGNVLYKAAGRAFLVNGGGASNITHNLIVNGGIGIYNQGYDDMTKTLPLYDNGTLHRGDKGDYIWRTELALGVGASNFSGIFRSALALRFPTFARLLRVNSTQEGWASPALSNFRDNIFLNNSGGNICFRASFDPTHGQACDADLPTLHADHFLDTRGSREGAWSEFPHAEGLSFVSARLNFNTTRAGLECDGWRRAMPAKGRYRPWVKASFQGVPSAASGPYSPEAAAVRAGLRSGQKLIRPEWTETCPTAASNDVDVCAGTWLAWGECQSDGFQVMRWTAARPGWVARLGGDCALDDGASRKFPCA